MSDKDYVLNEDEMIMVVASLCTTLQMERVVDAEGVMFSMTDEGIDLVQSAFEKLDNLLADAFEASAADLEAEADAMKHHRED